jgi:hypothetical protein
MKSGKQRRAEIKAHRLARAAAVKLLDCHLPLAVQPSGTVAADPEQLAHNNSYGLPCFYADTAFVCRDCGSHEVWTAKQQKWWYEIAKGPISSRAVRCRSCRALERARVVEARRVSQEGMARKLDEKNKREKQ